MKSLFEGGDSILRVCKTVSDPHANQIIPWWHANHPVLASIISHGNFIVRIVIWIEWALIPLLPDFVQCHGLAGNRLPIGLSNAASYNPALRDYEINSFDRFSSFNCNRLSRLAKPTLFRQDEFGRGRKDVIASRRHAFELIEAIII